MVPIRAVASVYKSLMERHKLLYGVKSLVPSRARPFFTSQIIKMIKAPEGTKFGNSLVSPDSTWWLSFQLYLNLSAQTGLRKSEAVVCSGDKWDTNHLSRASVSWIYQSTRRAYLTRAELLSLGPGDFVVISPPPSKMDPFSLVWGHRPIFGPYDNDAEICMARAVRNLFLYVPVAQEVWAKTPLVVMDDISPMTGSFVESKMRQLLTHPAVCNMTEAEASRYTPHSFRVFLATQLRSSGHTDCEIQAMCRWQSLQSLQIYALLDAERYKVILDAAMAADSSAVRSQDLPAIDACDIVTEETVESIISGADGEESD
jgi:hypothetical protein